ncbi:MAG: flagellar hook-length control protein FliK [Methylococcales bacterium]|nr:flagellar hook-length control protein FliK [Methylococcales bacterium]
MITTVTTTPSVINGTVTPVTDGATNPATVGTTTPSDAFSSTLNTQLGLVSPAVTETTTLATTQAALLVTTAAASTDTPTNITTLSTQQPASLIDTQIETPLVLDLPKDLPEMAMSAQDEAILSNVNDTLKFIATGSKLGDTLQAGQSVQVPSTNLTTSLTQETVQSAVQQVITNTQVNTPAAFVAQQATPVQVGQVAVETPNTDAEPVVVLSQVQNSVATQTQPTEEPIVAAQTQTKTPEQSVATTPVEAETGVVEVQTETLEQPVVTEAQGQTPVAKTPEQSRVTQTQVQTPLASQAETEVTVESLVTQAQVQTPVSQTETAEKATITTQVPVQKSVLTDEAVNETVSATPAQIATTEKAVATAPQAQVQPAVVQAETETAETPAVVAQTQVQRVITTQVGTPLQAVVSSPAQKLVEQQLDKTGEENTPTDPTLLAQTATQTVVQNVVEQDIAKPETLKTENQDTQPALVTEQNVAPLVAAQAAPIRVEAEPATFETSSAPEDKPTLTPAKDLLADILANRNNGGDMAGNSGDKKGSDTPSNTVLQADNLLKNSPDSKQGVETKSFASLLSAEKPDVASATQATPTADKSAPQVMAAVNKLADSIKTDVPALTRPLSHPNWNQEMGERIVWMNNRGISSAEIRMNPQNMGPITVRIDMNQDQATIAFTAQNADVRTALEASIPKLREMLSSQNVNLTDVNVSQQSSTNADSGRSQQQAAQMAADASANGQGGNRQNQEVDANGNVVSSVNANGEEVAVDEFANGQVLQDNGANGLLSIFA